MTQSFATTQTVINVSGTTSIASIASAKTAEMVVAGAPATSTQVIEAANTVMTNADTLALCSFAVLLFSTMWNVYSTRRRNNILERNHQLDREKHQFELDKFRAENNNRNREL